MDAGPKRTYEAATVIPLTCHQVMTAEAIQGDSYKSNGRPLQYVQVVGIVREFKQEGNSIKVKIADATGHVIEVQKWGTDVAAELVENANKPAEEQKHMIRVTGHVRGSKDAGKVVMATRISLVQHFEEFMAHQLHASYALMYAKHGPLPKPVKKDDTEASPQAPASFSPQGAQQQRAAVGAVPPPMLTPAAAPSPPSPQDQADAAAVKKAIMVLCSGNDEGVHKDKVVEHVQASVKGAAPGRTKDMIEALIIEGDLFTTTDAFHVSS